jgi:cell division protein FtsB
MTRRPQIASSGLTLVIRWAIVAALTVLLISMATGQSGISNYVALLDNKVELENVNMQLSLENQFIENQIHKLKTNQEAQVRFLKEEYGYIEKGEYVYHFARGNVPEIKAKSNSKSKDSQKPSLKNADKNESSKKQLKLSSSAGTPRQQSTH